MFKDKLTVLLREAKKNGVSASKIAKELGFKRSQFSDWKIGRNTPSARNLEKIAKYFDVSTDYLLKDEEENAYNQNFGNNNTIVAGSNNKAKISNINSSESDLSAEESELIKIYRSLDGFSRLKLLREAISIYEKHSQISGF